MSQEALPAARILAAPARLGGLSWGSLSWGGLGRASLRAADRALVPLALPLALLGVWAWVVHARLVSPLILPPPSLVLATGLDLLRSGELAQELGVSLWRVLMGLLLGGGLGLALGIAAGLSRTVEDYVGPTIRAVFLVPTLGWFPFLMLFLGIGEALKLALIGKACFLPLFINAFESVRALPRKYIEVARVLELPRVAALRLVIVPAILPGLFAGLRYALSKGWKALVVVEVIASAAGIGYLMSWGRTLFQLDLVMVTMVVIGLTGWALDHGLLLVERRLTRWTARSAP